MTRGVLVFDFDGTIADSKKLYVDIIYHSLLKHSFNVRNARISEHPKNARHFFGYSKSKVARALGPKLEETLKNLGKFSPKTVQKLKKEMNNDVTKKAKKIKLCTGAKEAIKRLEKNNKIILLTNSTKKFVISFLKKNKMLKYFDKLFYAENFGKKEDALKAIAKKYKVKISNIIYVADKKADVQIAKNAGCRIIVPLACSWDKKLFHRKSYTIKSLKQLEAAL